MRFDARGHGGSDVPPGPYSLNDLGGDVVALMDRLDIAKAHFIGLSMSGGVGQWLMIHAPDRLDRIVLANTAAYFPNAEGWNGRIRAARADGMATLAPAVAQRWLTPAFRAADPQKFAAIENLLRANAAAGLCGLLLRLARRGFARRAARGAAASGSGDRRRGRSFDAARAG